MRMVVVRKEEYHNVIIIYVPVLVRTQFFILRAKNTRKYRENPVHEESCC